MPRQNHTAQKNKGRDKKTAPETPPHLNINKDAEIAALSKVSYKENKQNSDINHRLLKNNMAGSVSAIFSALSSAGVLPGRDNFLKFHITNFLERFNKHVLLNHIQRQQNLATLVFRIGFIEKNFDAYTDEDKLQFSCEIALVNQEANNIIEAEKYAKIIWRTCHDNSITTPFTETEIAHKQLQAILLLLKMYRGDKQKIFSSSKGKPTLRELIEQADKTLNRYPGLTTERAHFLTSCALISLMEFETTQRKECDLWKLTEIYNYLRQSFIYYQSNELPILAFDRDKIYKDIIDLANTLPRLIIHFLDYDYPAITTDTRLLACKTALAIADFSETIADHINTSSEILTLIKGNSLQKPSSTKNYIAKKIDNLAREITEQAMTEKQPIKTSLKQASPSLENPALDDISTKFETTNVKVPSVNKSAIKTDNPSMQLDQAELYLLKNALSAAEEIYYSLLKDDKFKALSLQLKIRILLGNAELNNLKGMQHAAELNLMARFNKAEPVTNTDIKNINMSNHHFEWGISYCDRGKIFIAELPDNDQLILVEDLLLTSLQKNLATLHHKQVKYKKKMNQLKASLIATGKWEPSENEKSQTAIMFKEVLKYKQKTAKLTTKLNNRSSRLSQKISLIVPVAIDIADTTPLLDHQFSYPLTVIGYLYPVTITNDFISAIGFVYPVEGYQQSFDGHYNYISKIGQFYALNMPHCPRYSYLDQGLTSLLPIDMQLNLEQDAKQMQQPGFTTNPNLFFPYSDKKITRCRSLDDINFPSRPSIKMASDRPGPIKMRNIL